ncbi:MULTISPECIES: cyclic nucleotide-binding domain-containing protein [Streptomyces]|uniref:cyclic nucleotide-binding domain-containing protein n=1 Tax=Streptomyces TaxID=1883 RepID=UPI001966A4C9|nr:MULTISPECIES: cyclic nucleotide-binding domain-containing protein [Streptomyces]QRX96328.1 cyclic nucleotide-binding domain-containing protein [Streptomyces noursei]UJB44922.1 cyclic nucleotide-binding domain-containing protein [Streptomyces sp. A1-5]
MGRVSEARLTTALKAELLDRVDHDRLSGLDELDRSLPVYRRRRRGVRVHAVWARDLSADQLRCLIEFRIAQYLRIGFVDPARLAAALDDDRPRGASSPDDLHVVACTDDGRVLCSALLRAPSESDPTRRMADRDRALFPVEEVHGSGVFDRLLLLPELRAVRVRELGGFVKRRSAEPLSELLLRAPVEVGVAMFRVVAGPLALPMDAVIGDLESSVAKLNLDFFGVRPVLVRGTSPRVPDGSFLGPRYEGRKVHPFAILTSDLTTALPRLDEIDRALDQPGLLSLFGLRSSLAPAERSTLSRDGADDLPSVDARPAGGDPHALADEILRMPLLDCLSRAEAVALASCLEEVHAEEGDTVVHRGVPEDAMYLVRSGTAVVQLVDERGRRTTVGEFRPGDHFGEIAVLFGGPRTASVVAATPLRLWRLRSVDYRHYLERVAEVDRRLTRIAAQRVHSRLGDLLRMAS